MFLKTHLLTTILVPLLSSTVSAQTSSSPTACNNSPSLCNRAYNNITHLGAHDSPFLRDATTSFTTSGNQYYNTTVQLDAGVRLLSAQVHKRNDTAGKESWHLCHSNCDLLDAGPLSTWLSSIKKWMDAHTSDVVTLLLVNSDGATPAELGAHFSSSGLDALAYVPASPSTPPTTWPTLQNLIANNTRLVTFVASLATPDPAFPYLLDEFSFVFENSFETEQAEDYSCNPDRPASLSTPAEAAASGKLFLMNHFLYSTQLFGLQTPNATYANITNAQTGVGSLGVSLTACNTVYARKPTFVLVDFFNVGPAMASVDAVNGVTGAAVGRKNVSTAAVDENSGNGGSSSMGVRGGGSATVGAAVVAVAVAVLLGV